MVANGLTSRKATPRYRQGLLILDAKQAVPFMVNPETVEGPHHELAPLAASSGPTEL